MNVDLSLNDCLHRSIVLHHPSGCYTMVVVGEVPPFTVKRLWVSRKDCFTPYTLQHTFSAHYWIYRSKTTQICAFASKYIMFILLFILIVTVMEQIHILWSGATLQCLIAWLYVLCIEFMHLICTVPLGTLKGTF